MNKIPNVERCHISSGLKGECAHLWCLFLANEADMRDDVFAYDRWKSMSEQIAPRNGMPVPSSVHMAELEQEIEKWIR